MRSCVGKRFWRVDNTFQIRPGANLAASSSFDSRWKTSISPEREGAVDSNDRRA